MLVRTLALLIVCLCGLFLARPTGATEFLPPDDDPRGDVEIVVGEDRTIYEYRANGVLMIIKVVPKTGRPYYMVPADGSPHYSDLDHSKKLYPQWVIFEW